MARISCRHTKSSRESAIGIGTKRKQLLFGCRSPAREKFLRFGLEQKNLRSAWLLNQY